MFVLLVLGLGSAKGYGENGHGRWTAEGQDGALDQSSGIVSVDPSPKPLPSCGEFQLVYSHCFPLPNHFRPSLPFLACLPA